MTIVLVCFYIAYHNFRPEFFFCGIQILSRINLHGKYHYFGRAMWVKHSLITHQMGNFLVWRTEQRSKENIFDFFISKSVNQRTTFFILFSPNKISTFKCSVKDAEKIWPLNHTCTDVDTCKCIGLVIRVNRFIMYTYFLVLQLMFLLGSNILNLVFWLLILSIFG